MHPSGVQFGLSRGLLQLRGEEVLLSDQLLETISLEARSHLDSRHPRSSSKSGTPGTIPTTPAMPISSRSSCSTSGTAMACCRWCKHSSWDPRCKLIHDLAVSDIVF